MSAWSAAAPEPGAPSGRAPSRRLKRFEKKRNMLGGKSSDEKGSRRVES